MRWASGARLESTEPLALSLDSTAGLSPEELNTPLHTEDAAAGVAGEETGEPSLSPADPNLAAVTRQQAQAEQQAQTIREAAAFYGLDLSQFEDDSQAFAHLVQQAQQARQANYYAQLGQQIAPHYAQVQQYLQQQQAQAQPKAERPAWEAPEFDERWMSLVDKDPNTGVYVAKLGVNTAFAEKVQAYADHVDKGTTTLARSPMDAPAPLIESVAQKLIEDRFGKAQETHQAQQIIAESESWLYATDAQGRRLVSADGKHMASPLGARDYTHIPTFQQAGVKDARTMAKSLHGDSPMPLINIHEIEIPPGDSIVLHIPGPIVYLWELTQLGVFAQDRTAGPTPWTTSLASAV